MGNRIKQYFKDWTPWEKLWLSSFSILILVLSFIWKDTWYGTIASLTGIICVVLTAKGKISNYYFGIVNVIFYAIVAFNSKYYGEVMLNILYFLPIQIWAIFEWKKHKISEQKPDDVKIKTFSWKQRLVWLLITIVATIGYAFVLQKLGGNLPWLSSLTVVVSIIAMIILMQRGIEQWILWIVVDIITVIMWVVDLKNGTQNISVLIMWIAYLINATYGFINWLKLLKRKENNE